MQNVKYVTRSQMISQEDYNFIAKFDTSSAHEREALIQKNPLQCAKTFYNLLGELVGTGFKSKNRWK